MELVIRAKVSKRRFPRIILTLIRRGDLRSLSGGHKTGPGSCRLARYWNQAPANVAGEQAPGCKKKIVLDPMGQSLG
jgi:hypothetical protein